MISNRLLQESLEDFKEIVRLPMALYDRNCTCVAGAENMAPEKEVFQTFCNSSADMQALGNRYLFRVGDGIGIEIPEEPYRTGFHLLFSNQ